MRKTPHSSVEKMSRKELIAEREMIQAQMPIDPAEEEEFILCTGPKYDTLSATLGAWRRLYAKDLA